MKFRNLSTQMIVSFVALVLLTVSAIGIPSIWLIRAQMDRQAWSQVDQGRQASRALYAARQSEVSGLAVLTAQRPTLEDLIGQEDPGTLSNYLDTLREGADLDLMLVCAPNRQPLAQSGQSIGTDVCREEMVDGFHVLPEGSEPRAWLLAHHPISDGDAPLGEVIVGFALDEDFVREMGEQTGVEHTLWVDGQPVASSLSSAEADRQWIDPSDTDGAIRGEFSIDGRPYYFTRLSLNGTQLEDELALPVADVTATQQRLIGVQIATILAVAAVGSILGIALARRIGRPLGRLTETATRMSKGDLGSPAEVETDVREIALVAQALESARVDLKRTLASLQEEKAWTDHLLEAIVEGIMTMDAQGRITFFSHGAERITGWQHDRVLGRFCDELFRPVEREGPFSQFIPAPGHRRKVTVELADGRQATLAITGANLTPLGGDNTELALVFRDVSEEEAVHRLLGHFLANVAHEFRTPLSALAASIELLLDRTPDLSPAELQELLNSLHLGIVGLQTLVDNLLESASIEAGRFRVHPRPADLREITAEALHTMQPLLEKHDQRLVVEFPATTPEVEADPRRIVQVLVNLLSNASKYGPDHADIAVGAEPTPDGVRVTVADRGPGIDPEQREGLFRPFVPPSSADRDVQHGAGLGLSVVKAIVEAHGGHVDIEDRPGGGSIFSFTLPAVEDR